MKNLFDLAAQAATASANASSANADKKATANTFMVAYALATRNGDADALLSVDAENYKKGDQEGRFYKIRGLISKARVVGKSIEPIAEDTIISTVYAALLKLKPHDPKAAEKAHKAAIMKAEAIDAKGWNSLTHDEQGALLKQGAAIVAAQADSIVVTENDVYAFFEGVDLADARRILDTLNTALHAVESEQRKAA